MIKINKKSIFIGTLLTSIFLAGCATSSTPMLSEKAPTRPESAEVKVPDGFRVVTIGVSGPPMDAINKDRTWPATLVQFQGKYFLVDCGGGATHGLLKAGINPAKVTNMLFTHHHADHNSDYFTFAIGGWNGPMGRRALNLVGPVKTKQLHEMMLAFYDEDLAYRMDYGFPAAGLIENVNIKEIEGAQTFELDGVKITTAVGVHTMYDLAYKFEAGGQSVVVTGDTAYSDAIIELSKNADILVIDAHMAEGDFAKRVLNTDEQRDNMRSAHMSNEDIAMTAAKANVKKIILTHLPPMKLDSQATIQSMRNAGFKGEIVIAETGGSYFPS